MSALGTFSISGMFNNTSVKDNVMALTSETGTCNIKQPMHKTTVVNKKKSNWKPRNQLHMFIL